jgi:hypothetical protein
MWVVQWLKERNLSLLSLTPTFLLFNWLLLASWILSLDEKGHFLNDYVKFTPWMHEQTVTEKDYQRKRWFLLQTFSYFTPLSVLLLIFLLCCICIVYACLAMQERRCNGVVGWLVTQIDNKIRWRLYQQNTYYKLAFLMMVYEENGRRSVQERLPEALHGSTRIRKGINAFLSQVNRVVGASSKHQPGFCYARTEQSGLKCMHTVAFTNHRWLPTMKH